ncbi:MAG: hypothetical protein GY854_13610 [Deltaproteobacteria bacterium]|nr:hypothetical protein [Deltaproteobacteria bacterium]
MRVAPVRAESERAREECPEGFCLFVEHDADLAKEAQSLVETLRLRLCKRGVRVQLRSDEPPVEENNPAVEESDSLEEESDPDKVENIEGDCPELSQSTSDEPGDWWVAHLRALSSEFILVAVDHLGGDSDEDLIREVPRGPDAGATAWTIALMIEDALTPYLDTRRELTPLGAGLAIIEPPAVGGMKKPHTRKKTSYPELRCLSIGLNVLYLGAVNDKVSDFLVGPRVGVQGLLGPRFIVSFSAGWIGKGSFENKSAGVSEGSISYVPLELLFGFALLSRPRVDIALFSGISTGFSTYKTSSSISNRQQLDVLFDPQIIANLEIIIHIYGPLSMYVNGGAAFPVTHDVLEINGNKVYRQDWVLPLMGVGVQLWI